jgi:hypothetical protein
MSVQSRVNTAIDAVKRGQQARADYEAEIAKLRPMLPKQREKGRAMLLPCIGKKYDVAVVKGEGKAAGSMVLNSEAESYEAAKTALRRMVDDIYGKVAGAGMADPVAKLLKDYAELTAAQKRKFKASI